jgi:hypothetical protein
MSRAADKYPAGSPRSTRRTRRTRKLIIDFSGVRPKLTLEYVLARVAGVEGEGRQFNAWCPAHNDEGSLVKGLSITDRGERVLLYCHSGCGYDEIVEAIHAAEPHDIEVGPYTGAGARPWKAGYRRTAHYKYFEASGQPLYTIFRYEANGGHKTFRRSWAVGKEWQRHVLYRLPWVVDAVARGETIFICEGEKDVDAMVEAGVVATCNPSGAKKWKPEYSPDLKGADVVIVADDDAAGWEHARLVYQELEPIVHSIRVVKARAGNDASDHLEAGYGVDEFEEVEL